jgi:hypothetical protein
MAQKTIGGLTVASSAADSDQLALWQSNLLKSVTRAVFLSNVLDTADTFQLEFPVTSPANGTVVVVNQNYTIGTIAGVALQMGAGSCTAKFQIADQGGANATDITGLTALSVTTSVSEATASAARTMLKTGSADRQLLGVLSSVVGAGPLYITVRYTRA